MIDLPLETQAEIKRLYAEKTTLKEIGIRLSLNQNQIYKVLDYAKYKKNYCQSKYTKKELKPVTEKTEKPKRINKVKQACIEWIKGYYVESDVNNFSLAETWKDYEFHCCNPTFKPMLSKSAYVQTLLELGFTRENRLSKYKNTETKAVQSLFNLERRH